MEGLPVPLIVISVAATAPVSGCKRRFCPELLTRRILSTVGLKSIEAIVPEIIGVNAVELTVLAESIGGIDDI